MLKGFLDIWGVFVWHISVRGPICNQYSYYDDKIMMVSVTMIATYWDMLEPFIPVSIVSHNEVLLFIATIELEKHQRYLPLSTPDEYIHSFPLNVLLFSLASSTLFCFSFRRKSLCCPSPLANVAPFFFSSELHRHFGFLQQIHLSHQRPSSVLICETKSIPGHSRRRGTNPQQQQTKLLVSLNSTKRSSDWRLDFSILWTSKLISLKASLTDRAAVDQKASFTFQSVTGQIRQRRPFLRWAPSVRRAGWLVMMVIFHVCYHNLHTSIFQITDVTGLMCLPSILMKTWVAVGPVICKQTLCKFRR